MARYIDVEPLEDKLKEHIKKTESELMLGALSTFLRLLDITPTADVVPVVRCRDCKRRKNAKKNGRVYLGGYKYYCEIARYGVTDDGFCFYGERRDDE